MAVTKLGAATAGGATRGLLFGAVAALALALFLVDSLGVVTQVVEPLRVVSPFRWSLGDDPLRHGFHPLMLPTLIACPLVVWAASMVLERRDLR